MDFDHDKTLQNLGEKIGFVLAYFVFTTVLFFVLTFLHKLPDSWTYINVMVITLTITFLGLLLKGYLK